MFSKIKTCVLNGVDGVIVDVETDISRGIPMFNIVGLADISIKESKDRVRVAIKNSEYDFPISRILTNLVPANIKKEGSHLDLPIAIGILKAMGNIKTNLENIAFIGELSLDGKLNKVQGALPIALHLKSKNIEKLILPMDNKSEAGIVKGIDIIPLEDLKSVVEYLNGSIEVEPYIEKIKLESKEIEYDFEDVKGQRIAKRGMEIAAAGLHNLLLIGPKGTGKTMMAKRLPSIMPKMSFSEILDITKIYSVAGYLKDNTFISERPFRDPHHTVSEIALCGGGRTPKPGEVSLAHYGILFLDEFSEFKKAAIEALRQPLEDNTITISRLNGTVTYPSNIMLIAAMNPCKCGNYGTDISCTCTQASIDSYLSKISGPILDRIDLHIEAEKVKYSDLDNKEREESSIDIQKRVEDAKRIQAHRYKNEEILYNSQLKDPQVKKYCKLDSESNNFLEMVFKKLDFSARAYSKILKISRTIADLDRKENIEQKHIAEAVQYRALDRKYWS